LRATGRAATLAVVRPLVEPGPPLSAADRVRFSRTTVLPQVAEVGQRRLRNSRVCVVGAGGLGSPALLYLAAAGVGTLGIVDRDVVDPTNLQRQVLHGSSDVGRRKVASARDAVHAVDPEVRVEVHDVDLDAGTAPGILGRYHLVLDGSDNFATRYTVDDACARLGIPLVWGSVLGFDAQVSVFWSGPPDGEGVDLRDLFPGPPAPGEVPSCAEAGVLGAMCGQVGALMATEAVKLIVGIGEPLLGRVAVLDALSARWREVPLRRSAERAARITREALPEFTADGGASGGPASPPSAAGGRGTITIDACGTTLAVSEGERVRLRTVTASDLARSIRSGEAPVVVDVREPHEHMAGVIPGALRVPLAELAAGTGLDALPRRGAVVLYCAGGSRAQEAYRLVRAAGIGDPSVLEGGIHAWWAHAAGLADGDTA
jgi:molybdopterin/thiamine biosynthesis adenylyltransferase/rhodanese-related sulfurtransferase